MVQLLAVGLILEWVFAHAYWAAVLDIVAAMTLIVGHATGSRGAHNYTGLRLDGTLPVSGSIWLIGVIGLVTVLHVRLWYKLQYVIPIMGMTFGNTLTDAGPALEHMVGELIATRDQAETILALGGTRWEATRSAVRTAVCTGMIPIINQMTVVDVVSPPDMITDQVLAG